MNHFQEQRAEWTILLKAKSKQELINCFNREVRVEGFGTYRSIYLSVLSKEIECRNWDFSEIIYTTQENPNGFFCLSNFVYLNDNKLHKIKTHFIYKEFKIFIN